MSANAETVEVWVCEKCHRPIEGFVSFPLVNKGYPFLVAGVFHADEGECVQQNDGSAS